jgi:hypothetical protein
MKKAVPLIVVLAAIAAALIIYFKRPPGTLELAPGFAADLAPADTVLFVEVPDMARTASRWNQTSLYKISQEPEWKEFTAKWGEFVAENNVAKEAFGVFGEIQKADPVGMYLALTNFDAAGPKLVGGFPYRGRKDDVENVIKKLREQITKAFPAAKSEVTDFEGTAVETLKDPKFTAVMAYRENWFFFATDTDLLLKTLSRYSKKDTQSSLSKDPLWVSAADKGSPDPDFRLWARWGFFADKIKALSAMGGQPVPIQYAETFPAFPTGMRCTSGASPNVSTISNAAVFCPCRRYGLIEFTIAIGVVSPISRTSRSASSKFPSIATTLLPYIKACASLPSAIFPAGSSTTLVIPARAA